MILRKERGPQMPTQRDGRTTAPQASASSARKVYPTPAASPFQTVPYRAARQTPRRRSQTRTEEPDYDLTQLPIPRLRTDGKVDLRILWSDTEDERQPGALLIKPRFSPAAIKILSDGGIDVSELTGSNHPAVRSRWRPMKSKQNSVLEVHGSPHTVTSAITARAQAFREAVLTVPTLSVRPAAIICEACQSRRYCPLTHEEKTAYGLLPGQQFKLAAVQDDFAGMDAHSLADKIFGEHLTATVLMRFCRSCTRAQRARNTAPSSPPQALGSPL